MRTARHSSVSSQGFLVLWLSFSRGDWMRSTTLGLAAVGFGLTLSIALTAQAPQGGRGGGPQGGGRQGGNPQGTFPAQQGPPGDPALIQRGQGLYGVQCRACHGADLRGGDIGGPNLLRSQLALNDLEGELIGPVITGGRQTPGMAAMPAIQMPPDDIKAVATYIHSVQATMRGQGSPPPGGAVELKVLVGDAAAGQTYFKNSCTSCHSVTGDLQGVGARFPDPTNLQNAWVGGGSGRGRGAASSRRQVTVTVTLANGQKI